MLKGYSDLADLPEDERIRIIGKRAETGERIGFFVDDDEKADRYIRKLTKRFRVDVIERKSDVLVKGTVFVKSNSEGRRMTEKPKMCTTSGEPVEKVRAEQTNNMGQHKAYIVLCPDERAKGFVRPYRDRYVHSGRAICGKYLHMEGSTKLGGYIDVCTAEPGHEGECIQFCSLVQPDAAKAAQGFWPIGCGIETTMGKALSETYARQPEFYGATFCCRCNKHLPVVEFAWSADGTRVGS